MLSTFILSPLLAFLFAIVVIELLRRLAFKIHMVDKPNLRKVHRVPIPLVGGVGVYLATTLSLGLVLPFGPEILEFKNTFLAASILLVMGVIDDRLDLNAKLKLVMQLILAHFVYEQGIKIESMYGLFGIYELSSWAQYLLTIFIIAGSVNAFNLMDGVDGLAAGLAFASFFVLACLAYVLGSDGVMTVMITFMAALLGFLRYNFSKRKKVFLGDAGSLMIGFILVVTGIRLIQAAAGTAYVSIAVVGVVSVLVIPVLDALRVFWKRMKAGNSPFAADKTHLHHLVLSLGKRHKMTSFSILLLMAGIVGIGYMIHLAFGLTAAILSMFVLFSSTVSLLGFQINLLKWKMRIREMEQRAKSRFPQHPA